MFEKNDYLSILSDIYSPALEGAGTLADLSGWEFSPFALTPPEITLPPTQEDLHRYYADSGNRLNIFKEKLAPALEGLENSHVDRRDFTLLPSTTSGIVVILSYLKEAGVNRLIVEAPTYFAVVDAATRIGLVCELVAPHETKDGQFMSDVERLMSFMDQRGTCLWLHQPHYALGYNLSCADLRALASKAKDGCYIVLDEANDDTVPTLTAGLHLAANVFRLRSLTKAFGLNGIRASLLLHPRHARDKVVDIMWSVGGALDWFSISMVEALTTPSRLYADLLRQMRERLIPQRQLIMAGINTAEIHFLPGDTGFLNCIRLDWRGILGTEEEKRQRLIRYLARHRVPAMLGAHIYMPKTTGFEHIRINLLNTPETLRRGMGVIQSFFPSVSSSSS